MLALQLITLALQPIALALSTLRAFAPLLDLPRPLIVGVRHIEVMPEARKKYKYEILDREVWGRARVRTR